MNKPNNPPAPKGIKTLLEVTEMEYQELSSVEWDNVRFNLRIKTTPATYEKDFIELVAEVKTRLQQLADMKKKSGEGKR